MVCPAHDVSNQEVPEVVSCGLSAIGLPLESLLLLLVGQVATDWMWEKVRKLGP